MSTKLLGKISHISAIIQDLDMSKSKHELIHELQGRLSNSIILDDIWNLDQHFEKIEKMFGKIVTNTITENRGKAKSRSYQQLRLFFAVCKDLLYSMGAIEINESPSPDMIQGMKEYLVDNFLPKKEVEIASKSYTYTQSISDSAGISSEEFSTFTKNIIDHFTLDYVENPENYPNELNFSSYDD